ncbi:TlpA family protein disulfide reductase [Chitinophaga sp. RCC_12]|uniref:TlpA family protein disulfide reductase n=1 Tax=Chitinophaga sp. RCC_12 TaxID=3239226 RepID=UPI003525AFF4
MKPRIIRTAILAIICLQIWYHSAGETLTTQAPTAGYINLVVNFSQGNKYDTLELVLINRFYVYNTGSLKIYPSISRGDGNFQFQIPVSQTCGYWQLYLRTPEGYGDKREITEKFFWEIGDSVTLKLSNKQNSALTGINSSYDFSGRGAEKYNLRNILMYQKSGVVKSGLKPGDYFFTRDLDNRKSEVLKQMKDKVSGLSYDVMKADLIFQRAANNPMFYVGAKHESNSRAISAGFDLSDAISLSSEGITESYFSLVYLYKKFRFDSFNATSKIDMDWIFGHIGEISNKALRDKLFVYTLCQGQNPNQMDSLIALADKKITDKESRGELDHLKAKSKKSIYSYQLETLNGATRSLADFAGKVVIMDFWTYGCGPCRALYDSVISKAELKYKGNNQVVFISIGCDFKDRSKKGVKEGLYASASTTNLFTTDRYCKIIDDFNIGKVPTVLVADKNGKIALFDVEALYRLPTFLTSIEAVLNKTE